MVLLSPETLLELLGILLHDRFGLGYGTPCDGCTRALTSKIDILGSTETSLVCWELSLLVGTEVTNLLAS